MGQANGNGTLRWVLGLMVGIALSLSGAAFGYTQARIDKLEDQACTRLEVQPQLEHIRQELREVKELLRERG